MEILVAAIGGIAVVLLIYYIAILMRGDKQ